VLSFGYFQRRFGAKNALIGATITVSGQPFEVIGVALERFRGVLTGNDPEIYLPISMRASLTQGWNNYDRPTSRWLTILGRLPANGDGSAIKPLFSTIVRDHVEQAKVMNPKIRQRIEAATLTLNPAASGLNEMKRQWQEPLVVLLIMVWLLLLIACANLANLLLARGVNRAREISIRVSIGATRAQIIKLLLVETAAITVTGAALGAAFAPVLVNLLLKTHLRRWRQGLAGCRVEPSRSGFFDPARRPLYRACRLGPGLADFSPRCPKTDRPGSPLLCRGSGRPVAGPVDGRWAVWPQPVKSAPFRSRFPGQQSGLLCNQSRPERV